MAAIVISQNAKAVWLNGIAGVRAKAREMVRRAMDYSAAAVLICAVGAALLQLIAELLSFPAPIAVTAITVIAAALLNSLRRHFLARSGHRCSPGNPHCAQRRPAGSGRVHAGPGRLRRLQPRSGS